MSQFTGKIISHYKIIEKLGEGGMGVVYKALDTNLDRFVALKFLPHGLMPNEAETARFLQEAKAASALNHPNVCTIYGIGDHEGQRFIEMEYVEGVTLREKHPVRKTVEAVNYAIQIGEALQEAHSKGIVHRDVKVDNIMVNSKDQIKVMDFGLAKLKGSMNLTRASSTVGTLSSMSPEQIQGGEIDARSDIFSFGTVLYEMLTARTPFRGEHEAAIVYSIVHEEPDTVAKYRPEVSPELERIVLRALEKDPADRYQTAADMVSELRRFQKQTTRVSRSLSPARAVTRAAQPENNGHAERSAVPFMRGRVPFLATAGSLVVAALAVLAYLFLFRHPHTIDSLAVLPFVSVGADPRAEYLSDGITESIINSLTRIRELRVIPRSTVFRYKGKDVDPQEAGSKLNVGAVLTGKIVQAGDNLDVQLDLIDVARQSQIWGDHFTRTMTDVLSLQEDIVNEVSKELRLSISGDTKRDLKKRSTENPEAYKLYLQGRFYWNKRTASDLDKAIGFFNQAIRLDPAYALAYAGLADCYDIQEQYAGVPGSESFPKAEAAAKKALEIDNTLAEAHATLAFVREHTWDWNGAEQEYRAVIGQNPNYPTAYHWYSVLLRSLGRSEEASSMIRKAQELDPLSPVISLNVALVSFYKGDFDETILQCRKILEMDAAFGLAHQIIGSCYARKGMYAEALGELGKAVELSGATPENLSIEGSIYAKAGRRAEAEKIIAELERRYASGTGAAYMVARVYAGLNENEKAFDWLEKSYRDRSGWLERLNTDYGMASIRSDTRYLDLLKRIGLPQQAI